MGGWVIMLKSLQTPQGLRCAFFCSQLGRLYLAQCLEDARCSVNICCLHDQLWYLICEAQCKMKIQGFCSPDRDKSTVRAMKMYFPLSIFDMVLSFAI